MQLYVPDTNFFLQCQSPDQIDWGLVTDADEVALLVVREVRKELDRLKSGGNLRRAKRARKASALLRRFTTERLQEIELRATDPRVVLRVAARATNDNYPPDYRVDSSDERIVAEAYALKVMTGDRFAVLSHDTVPLEDASGLGMQIQPIPDEWLLDPEPNEFERELEDVKRRMKTLEGRSPDIVVHLPTDERGCVRLRSDYFHPPSDAFVAAAMRAVKKQHALGQRGGAQARLGVGLADIESITDGRWTRYTQDHEQWLIAVENMMRNVCLFLNEDPNAIKVVLSVSNNGSVGAENLIVRIEALGDFHFVDAKALNREEPSQYFPGPPPLPRGRLAENLMGTERFSQDLSPDLASRFEMPRLSTPPMARDRHAIYWEFEDDHLATYAEGQCRDFRHGLGPTELVLPVQRNASGQEPIQGGLGILVSAGNLSEPHRVTVPIRIEADPVESEGFLRNVLKLELSVDA